MKQAEWFESWGADIALVRVAVELWREKYAPNAVFQDAADKLEAEIDFSAGFVQGVKHEQSNPRRLTDEEEQQIAAYQALVSHPFFSFVHHRHGPFLDDMLGALDRAANYLNGEGWY